MLSWDRPGATGRIKTRTVVKYSTLSPVQAKLIDLKYLKVIKKKADHAPQIVREPFEENFSKRGRHCKIFRIGDWINIGKHPSLTKEKTEAVTQGQSKILIYKKDGPFTVLRLRNQLTRVDFNETCDVVSIDRSTLVKTAEEVLQTVEVERHVDVPWEADNTRDGYVVQRIVCNKDDYDRSKFLVRKYGYSPAEDL